MTASELEDRWSYNDLIEAHDVLDMLEDAQIKARLQSEGVTHG